MDRRSRTAGRDAGVRVEAGRSDDAASLRNRQPNADCQKEALENEPCWEAAIVRKTIDRRLDSHDAGIISLMASASKLR